MPFCPKRAEGESRERALFGHRSALVPAVTEYSFACHVKLFPIFQIFIMILFTSGLLLLALSGCFSRVVDDFSNICPQFFANPGGAVCTPTVFPDQNRYKQICQSLYEENETYVYEYATLYDTANKIPVYSAYKFEGLMGCERSDNWFIEPELDNPKAGGTMKLYNKVEQLPNQAVNKDYNCCGYDKGHLAPVLHARTQECSDATFTLTNAAPQNRNFNRGKWRQTEKNVSKILEEKCRGNSRYIVTGVVPGSETMNNRVRVPSHFWTAYICLDNNQRVTAAEAVIGENKVNSTLVSKLSISMLESFLNSLYQEPFSVFCGYPKEITTFEGSFSSFENRMQQRVLRCQKCSPAYYRKRCVERVLHYFLRAKNKKSVRTDN